MQCQGLVLAVQVNIEILKIFYKNSEDVGRDGIKSRETRKGCYTVKH